ncbi:MAG: TRAP transporter small permease [Geminicoccaceae bacterium]|nr:TRAP transporter small permease [Geminicoccaceae bacterium]MCS7267414.1 TRAP transporter small permease [Geminicoccaceae bacterium]MCX7629486.1 TRAP transporter small permease [Geminicoccaceae bacterium]MDW8125653.1 TRAP transporter small permease [Geminicoccaceae bacterium]MDW8339977.1 TRAP transporter small permease [Geminicoccaceae bacterium]
MIRRALERLYDLAGVLAAVAMVAILGTIVAQILARALAFKFPGGTDYAGYFMAAASFFALAHTFRRGGHIRVELLLQRLAPDARRRVEIAVHAIGAALAWYFAYYAARHVHLSWVLGDVSQGQDATPLWIPQLSMATGVALFAVALTHRLVELVFGLEPALAASASEEKRQRAEPNGRSAAVRGRSS